MAYSGPAIDSIRLHYPYEAKNGDPDWGRLILEVGDAKNSPTLPSGSKHIPITLDGSAWALGLPDMAFFRGAMIGFRAHPSPNWILREVTQTGFPDKASPDLADFYHYLDGLGVGYPSRRLLDWEAFWKRYTEVTAHPQVLLDVVARQAFDSLKDL